jgi:hypothetical protein
MKKRYFVFIFSVLCCIVVFGDTGTQEEVDFLLFSPNSGSRFENEEKAFVQLNNLAQYLLSKNLVPGQIIVYGYAAYAPNEIKSTDLSKERALTVMEELQKRGVSKELFADPVGYGAVYLWGNNDTENTRKLNRRVRVLLDGESPMPITQDVITAEAEASANAEDIIPEIVYTAPVTPEITIYSTLEKVSFKFPWWILPLLAFLALAFLLFFLLGKKSRKTVYKDGIINAQAPEAVIIPEPEPAKVTTTYTVNLDEEIRARAYELSRQRRIAGQCDEQGDYRELDWHNAVREISAWYIACGHSVFSDGEAWWASNTVEASPTENTN